MIMNEYLKIKPQCLSKLNATAWYCQKATVFCVVSIYFIVF